MKESWDVSPCRADIRAWDFLLVKFASAFACELLFALLKDSFKEVLNSNTQNMLLFIQPCFGLSSLVTGA